MSLPLSVPARTVLLALLLVPGAALAADKEPNPKSPGSFDLANLDRTLDPCVDFYQFACGGWRQANPIPGDQSRWGRFNELAERNREVLHQILEQAKDAKPGRSPLEAKVGDYYAACMDEAGIEAKGTKPLEPLLASVDRVKSKADLFRLFGENHSHALPGLFGFFAAPDLHDSKQTIASLGQGGLGLPDRDDYFAATGAPEFSRLNVSSKKYFEEANGLVDATKLADWKTYLRWHQVRAAAPYLAAAFVREDYRFNDEYLNGIKQMETRWKRCVQATDRGLGDALGQLYVEKTFGPDGKARMRKMIDALTAALREDIEGLPWMTAETKQKALTKLAAFNTSKVGYPEHWKDYGTVEVKRDDYAGNARRARIFEIRRNYAKIGKPTDRSEWGMTPPTVNAYYNAANNEIVFPAGILQPPFFDRQLDDAVNFGGIGVVIGHEYTHGFDDQGSKFDPEGNLQNWWTPEDLKQFQERTDCIAKEYDGFVTVKDEKNGDVHLNGRLTLGENTADNGGARVAYRALQKALAGQARQPIDGFTPEQRFFLGFANVWCENTTEQAARQRAQTDAHASGRYRVIGTISNMEEFQKAFACQAGQPMVRENACRAW